MTNDEDYYLYVLIKSKWHFIEKAYTINEVNIAIKYIMSQYPDKQIQVLKGENVLCCLNGSEYQQKWFYYKYVLKIKNCDYLKNYEDGDEFEENSKKL